MGPMSNAKAEVCVDASESQAFFKTLKTFLLTRRMFLHILEVNKVWLQKYLNSITLLNSLHPPPDLAFSTNGLLKQVKKKYFGE